MLCWLFSVSFNSASYTQIVFYFRLLRGSSLLKGELGRQLKSNMNVMYEHEVIRWGSV